MDHKCDKCGRLSSVVKLSKTCPFCEVKEQEACKNPMCGRKLRPDNKDGYCHNEYCEYRVPLQEKTEEWWEKEFREYFDKTLKPKKPTIKNLDRELIVDFIKKVTRQTLLKDREELKRKIEGMIKKESDNFAGDPSKWEISQINYNRAIIDVLNLLK